MSRREYKTDRLILRPTFAEDAPFILELFNTPKWLKYVGDRNIHSDEDAKEYIKNKISPQYEKLGYGNYTVFLKSENIPIGTCGLYNREGVEGVDIGFAFLPEYEGKGYAFESVSLVMNVGFEEFGLKKIVAITTRDNISSQKLLKKIGLSYVKMIKIPNDKEELMLFESKT